MENQEERSPEERPQPSNAPIDEEVHSTPIGEHDRVVPQENVGRTNMEGSGEWPSPQTPPTGSAPGEAAPGPAPGDPNSGTGTDTQGDLLQDGRSGGTPGPARAGEGPTGFKEVLDADPVTGGSSSVGTLET
jgi:hypothetical protein